MSKRKIATKSEFDIKTVIKNYGGKRIADALGLSRQAVYMWDTVPAKHALKVSELLEATPHQIRPDIYPENWSGAGE